jgi:hypothetical protein
MPKEGFIRKIYKRKYEDVYMLAFVRGMRNVMPALSVEKCLYAYFKELGIRDFNIESSRVEFNRMQNEFYEAAKEK